MNRKLNSTIALFLFLLLPLNAFAAGSISGKVIRQGRTNHSSPITFKLKNPGEAAIVQTYNVTTASDGSYVISTVPAGVYNLSAKASNSLSQNQVLIEVSDGHDTSNINFSLLGGDCDNNNVVSGMDFAILRAAYGTKPGNAKWDPRADFNGNNQIDGIDFSILTSNYGKSGAEPNIKITSPQNNAFTNVSSITVSGTITDYNSPQPQVTIDGIQAVVLNNAFTASNIPLAQGQNKISAIATNSFGIKNADLVSVAFDTIAPVIAITSPANGFLSSAQTIIVSGTIDDNQATVTVNGTAATVSNGAFSASAITLTPGQNTITADATDLAGNTSSASITVTYQPNTSGDTTPPSITIYTPDKDSTTRSNIVYGRVSDDTQTVTVNGTTAEISSDFRFIARPTLTEGANTITVQATDKAGNTSQASVSMIYNTQTPKVTIASPIDNATINISPINVQGTNTTDLKYILIGSLPAHIDGVNFTVESITLTLDHTVITAEGYDANDNLFEDSVFVISPQLANYQFTGVIGNTDESNDTRPVAGTTQTLKVTLQKNGQLAPNQEIDFNIAEGNGALSGASAFTDDNGNAQVILTTDSSSSVVNKVNCFVANNPLVKTTFVVYTKPGAPSTLTKISDDSITPVPGATIDLIVKLTDLNNNPISDENINFQIIQGTGTLSAVQAATTSYGEAKVTLTTLANPNVTTQVIASSPTNPNLSVTFNITTSPATILTFNDIMGKVQQNEDKILDLMADVTVTSNEPFSKPERQFKLWMKGNKSKVQVLSPIQKTSIIETTPNSINLNGQPFLTVTEGQTDPSITRADTIESSSGDIYVLKTIITSNQGFTETTKYYIDYPKGVFIKTEDEYKDQDKKEYSETTYSSVLIGDIWVMSGTVTKQKDFYVNQEYTTTETRSNIIINSGLPDSVFQ